MRGGGRRMRLVLLVLSATGLAVVLLMALLPALLATHDPLHTDVRHALQPPGADHWFGTDQSGRDVYSRVVHGAYRSLGIAVLATSLALVLGMLVGAAAGTAPRVVDAVIVRGNDLLLAFPEFLLALVVVALLGPGTANVAIALTLASLPVYVRIARVQTQMLRKAEHVEAARILGVPAGRAFLRHVAPGVLGSLSVLATIGLGTTVLAAAGLGFLGLGPVEPAPEWGLMLAGGRSVLGQAWWISLFPGIATTITVLSASCLGRMLRMRAEGGIG